MKLAELFLSRTAIRLLDWLLEHPHGVASQGALAKLLDVAPITVRRTLKRLEALGLVKMDLNPAGFGIKVIAFNDETRQGRAVLTLHRRIATLQPESTDHDTDNSGIKPS